MLASAYELNKQIENKKKRAKLVFEKVLESCDRRIQSAAAVRAYECVFTVPTFVMGFPLYDVDECMDYVLRKLVSNGFLTDVLPPRSIRISWNIKEARKKMPAELPALPMALPMMPVMSVADAVVHRVQHQSAAAAPAARRRSSVVPATAFHRSIVDLKPNGSFVLKID